MAVNGRKWLEMAGKGWQLRELAGNGLKLLEMACKAWNWLELAEKTGN